MLFYKLQKVEDDINWTDSAYEPSGLVSNTYLETKLHAQVQSQMEVNLTRKL